MKYLAGFHAIRSRLRLKKDTVREIYIDAERKDNRVKDLRTMAEKAGVRVLTVDAKRIAGMAGSAKHQGVIAAADDMQMPQFVEDVLDTLDDVPLLLILDGVTDPHNLGACLRAADGAGAHAVIAPKDRSCGLTVAAIKVASGAAETVPFISVTNLARTMRDLKDRGIWLVGTDDEAPQTIYQAKLDGPLGLVLGAEGEGLRRLTKDTCDFVASIPMHGTVESLNVAVASGVCLFEARRRRATR